MKKSLLEGLIQILTEAPMSDEDREDSEKLRQIFNKRSGRSNAKLTADEKALLDKYGLSVEGRWVSSKDGRPFSSGNVDRLLKIGNKNGHYDKNDEWVSAKYGNNKVNFADMARKQPERRYAQDVKNRWDDNDLAGYGGDTNQYKRRWGDHHEFQAKERTYNTLGDKYYKDYNAMKSSIDDRNSANRNLADYDKDKKEIDDKYQKDLDTAKRQRQDRIDYLNYKNKNALDRRANANQKIDDIKDKYRRNRVESMNESYAHVTYFDYKGNFKEKTIQGDTPKSVINKIKKINDSFGVYNIEIASKDIAYSPELKALGLDVNKVDLLTSGWN